MAQSVSSGGAKGVGGSRGTCPGCKDLCPGCAPAFIQMPNAGLGMRAASCHRYS